MLKTRFAYRSAGCIIVLFALFSFTEKGESSGRSFHGFCKPGIQSENDTLPKRKARQGSSLDDTNMADYRAIERQIEETLQRVEEKLGRLEAELSKRFVARPAPGNDNLLSDRIDFKQLKDETKSSLLRAQAQYDRAMRRVNIENNKHLRDMQLQLDRAQQLASNYNHNLNLELESKVRMNLEKAKDHMKKANEKLQKLRSFKDDLEKDGLIKKGASYTIEIKEGRLYINGERQSQKINKKYKNKYGEYFEERNNFKLQSNEREYLRERERELI
ncbi:MAG: hypothetical protein KF746_10795 [Chitinophagaceae bacterium]|nr:hypothetical protein [Chitinophagaceae bacterium]